MDLDALHLKFKRLDNTFVNYPDNLRGALEVMRDEIEKIGKDLVARGSTDDSLKDLASRVEKLTQGLEALSMSMSGVLDKIGAFEGRLEGLESFVAKASAPAAASVETPTQQEGDSAAQNPEGSIDANGMTDAGDRRNEGHPDEGDGA